MGITRPLPGPAGAHRPAPRAHGLAAPRGEGPVQSHQEPEVWRRGLTSRARLGLAGPSVGSRDAVQLRELALVNFRNYVRLALAPGQVITVLVGDNGQGKSNILEAIYL